MSQAAMKNSPGNFSLKILSGPDEGAVYQLISTKVTLGRSPENDISFVEDPKMSRKHAVISVEGPAPRITDISGKNFMLVDDEQCKEAVIGAGSKILLGSTTIEFQIHDGPKAANGKMPVAGHERPPISSVDPQQMPMPRPMVSPQPSMGLQIEREPLNAYNAPSPHAANLPKNKIQNKRVRFYAIVGIVFALLYFLLSSSTKLTDDKLKIRSTSEILKEQEASRKRAEAIEMQKTQLGTDTRQYDEAQASYIRCFRDYQQGQYTRAIQHCQASLSIFPNHELAERYLLLAQRKRDERMQFLVRKGKLYLERGYYSRCMATLVQVMYDLKSPNHPLFQEARQLHSECRSQQEDRY